MAKHEVNAMDKRPMHLVDALANIIAGDERFVNHDQALNIETVSPLKTEKLWLVKSSRPAPTLMSFQTGNQGGESTFFVAIFVMSEASLSVYINKEILPNECKEEGCWCGQPGQVCKKEILDWLAKEAPQVQVVMAEEHQLSALYYDGFVEFFADTIKNQQAEQQT